MSDPNALILNILRDHGCAPESDAEARIVVGEILEVRDTRLQFQLERANRIIGWMMPYIGKMCTPPNGLYDLNLHCCENVVPDPEREASKPHARKTVVGATGQVVWFAHVNKREILRDKRGIGRRFRSEKSALTALAALSSAASASA